MKQVLFVFFFACNLSFGQELERIHGIETRGKIGFLLPHRPVMHHLLQGHSRAFEASYVIQTNGNEEWQQSFRLPRWGGTAYFSDFGNPEQLGWAGGAYLFGELPIVRVNKFAFMAKLGGGLAYVSKKYDKVINPKNNSIGSHWNSLIVVGVATNYQLKQSELSLGLDMTHLSNGATVLPNLGINVPYLSLGYTHYLKNIVYKDEPLPMSSHIAALDKWQLNVMGIVSTKQIYPTGGRNYLVSSLGIFATKKFSRKAGMDLGLDIIYNGSLKDRAVEIENVTVIEAVQVGLFAGYFIPINRLRVLLGMGYYIKDNFSPEGPFYHRLAVRYKLTEKWNIHFGIKSHWGKADYIEYGIFYKIK
jgi:hypothetical protein